MDSRYHLNCIFLMASANCARFHQQIFYSNLYHMHKHTIMYIYRQRFIFQVRSLLFMALYLRSRLVVGSSSNVYRLTAMFTQITCLSLNIASDFKYTFQNCIRVISFKIVYRVTVYVWEAYIAGFKVLFQNKDRLFRYVYYYYKDKRSQYRLILIMGFLYMKTSIFILKRTPAYNIASCFAKSCFCQHRMATKYHRVAEYIIQCLVGKVLYESDDIY